MKEILSKNILIKEVKNSHKKYRNQTNTYIIDGWHLVQEAIAASAPINYLFVTDKGIQETGNQLKDYQDKVFRISDEVAAFLSDLPTPQRDLCSDRKRDRSKRFMEIG